MMPEEARLRDAEQEAHGAKLIDSDERHPRGDDSPGDHDARDPHPRPESPSSRLLGTRTGRSRRRRCPRRSRTSPREAEIRVHRQRSEPNVHAIEVGHEIAEHQERNQPAVDLLRDGAHETLH
jgi:hypothetical protein